MIMPGIQKINVTTMHSILIRSRKSHVARCMMCHDEGSWGSSMIMLMITMIKLKNDENEESRKIKNES